MATFPTFYFFLEILDREDQAGTSLVCRCGLHPWFMQQGQGSSDDISQPENFHPWPLHFIEGWEKAQFTTVHTMNIWWLVCCAEPRWLLPDAEAHRHFERLPTTSFDPVKLHVIVCILLQALCSIDCDVFDGDIVRTTLYQDHQHPSVHVAVGSLLAVLTRIQ